MVSKVRRNGTFLILFFTYATCCHRFRNCMYLIRLNWDVTIFLSSVHYLPFSDDLLNFFYSLLLIEWHAANSCFSNPVTVSLCWVNCKRVCLWVLNIKKNTPSEQNLAFSKGSGGLYWNYMTQRMWIRSVASWFLQYLRKSISLVIFLSRPSPPQVVLPVHY